MISTEGDEPPVTRLPAFLDGVRIVEVADELGEYCGKLLAGLGADVVKVEPPEGEVTRRYGPFLDDVPDPEKSLYFWHYNFGKRSIAIDLGASDGKQQFECLVASADAVIVAKQGVPLPKILEYDSLRRLNAALVHIAITPFGADGPWSRYRASDAVHLALGGVMMNCGYDPEPDGCYDTPPIAPQMWQAYQISGEMAVMGGVAALLHAARTGIGQTVTTAVHEAVSMNTETDVPNWTFLRQEHHRLTCRHSLPQANSVPPLSMTKDGRWLLPYRTYLSDPSKRDDFAKNLRLLRKWNMQDDLDDPKYQDPAYRADPNVRAHITNLVDVLVRSLSYDRELWRDAQAEGMAWAPVVHPHELAMDNHWRMRGAIQDVYHPAVGREIACVVSKWYSPDTPWANVTAAPRLGEHTDQVLAEAAIVKSPARAAAGVSRPAQVSPAGRERQPLDGVRVLDLSWLLATGGAGRYLAAMGAEVVKVEHHSRWDTMRFSPQGTCPAGGRAERSKAQAAIPTPAVREDPNRGGSFMEINAGKRSVSLNLKHPDGQGLLARLIKQSDVILEGFSPGALSRMGFGYTRLRQINPSIIYVSQSGLGEYGEYGSIRTFGPSAAAFAGLSDMSGLPEPYPPAGIGYSYLDWFGAYNVANAVLAALYRRHKTGYGTRIDASQAETGMYLTGTAVIDYSANGREWRRAGNRSPYKPAAPHGAYRARGSDRWIVVACFDEADWKGLLSVIDGKGLLGRDSRFGSLEDRLAHQAELDAVMEVRTSAWDPYELMQRLQEAGVAAGVCQTAEDRCERDPQLRHLGWRVELPQTEIGTWPVKKLPFRMSATPPRIGGRLARSGPNYGEDNDYVLRQILDLDDEAVQRLRELDAI